jgi:hypothetical protein
MQPFCRDGFTREDTRGGVQRSRHRLFDLEISAGQRAVACKGVDEVGRLAQLSGEFEGEQQDVPVPAWRVLKDQRTLRIYDNGVGVVEAALQPRQARVVPGSLPKALHRSSRVGCHEVAVHTDSGGCLLNDSTR